MTTIKTIEERIEDNTDDIQDSLNFNTFLTGVFGTILIGLVFYSIAQGNKFEPKSPSFQSMYYELKRTYQVELTKARSKTIEAKVDNSKLRLENYMLKLQISELQKGESI